MKLALVLAFALLALSLPASAATAPTAAPAEASIQAPTADGALPFLDLAIKPIIRFCDSVQGTTCGGSGATTTCTDVCGHRYTCTCSVGWPGGPLVWHCPFTC